MNDLPIDSDAQTQQVLTVSELNAQVNGLLEIQFPSIWVSGEVSNFARPASGHWYFTLKDSQAQVRCAMFRGRNRSISHPPQDGEQIIVRARISLYQPRGDYQLIVEQLQLAGDGALRQAFEALSARLAAAGLFAQERKQALPGFPRRLGIITSPTGAAIRDILQVLERRFPALPVLLYPVPVQGKQAAPAIATAINKADQRHDCDVLIVARGGGSLEDLWPFNDESVAYAIADCSIPIVTGIGHEVDLTIADLVADWRAPTPSVAAAAVTPERETLQQQQQALAARLVQLIQQRLTGLHNQLQHLHRRLSRQHPSRQLERQAQRLDELTQRLQRAGQHHVAQQQARFEHLHLRLRHHHPQQRLSQHKTRLADLERRLRQALQGRCRQAREHWQNLARGLQQVSPLATLERGYAIATRAQSYQIISDSTQVQPGEAIWVRLANGRLHCEVQASEPDDGQPAALPKTKD